MNTQLRMNKSFSYFFQGNKMYITGFIVCVSFLITNTEALNCIGKLIYLTYIFIPIF